MPKRVLGNSLGHWALGDWGFAASSAIRRSLESPCQDVRSDTPAAEPGIPFKFRGLRSRWAWGKPVAGCARRFSENGIF